MTEVEREQEVEGKDKWELKPNRKAFVFYSSLFSTFLATVLAVLISSVLKAFFQIDVYLYAPLAVVAFLGFALFERYIVYGKTSYSLGPERLIYRTGGIFAKEETELLVQNITHMNLHLPLVEHFLFKTGNIYVQSAGSGQAEISLSSIDNPRGVLEGISQFMRENEFSLLQSELEEREKQSWRGILVDSVGWIGGGLMMIFFFAIFLLDISEKQPLPAWTDPSLITLLSIVGVIFLLYNVYLFGSAANCDYQVYDDSMIEEIDFWGFRKTLVPMENLSDVTLNQGVVKKILGVADLQISCQGSGQEIYFRNVHRGEEIRDRIDTLIERMKREQTLRKEEEKAAASEKVVGAEAKGEEVTFSSGKEAETDFQCEMFMDPTRAKFGAYVLFFCALFFGGITAALYAFIPEKGVLIAAAIVGLGFASFGGLSWLIQSIRVWYTKYSIRPRSFASRFSFLVTRYVEFNTEKVTGVIKEQNLLDRILKTYTLRFDSIGSSDTLKFQYLKEGDDTLERVLAKEAIYLENPQAQIRCDYNLGRFFARHFWSCFFTSLLLLGAFLGVTFQPPAVEGYVLDRRWAFPLQMVILGLPLVGLAVIHIYLKLYYNRVRLDFYDDFVRFYEGLINLSTHYVRYREIKDMETCRYPLCDGGGLRFDYSGERLQQQGGEGKQKVLVSNHFNVPYLTRPLALHRQLDRVWAGIVEVSPHIEEREEIEVEEIDSTRPQFLHAFGPGAVALFLTAIFAFGGLIFFHINSQGLEQRLAEIFMGIVVVIEVGLFVGLYLYIRSIVYVVEGDRVVRRWGVVFKKEKSINYRKVDFINKHQSVWNRLFGTGDLAIHTVGSSYAEMKLNKIPNYEEFYSLLQEKYQK